MDRQMLNRLQFEVGSFQFLHLLDVVNLVELQNLGELNLDADLTCQVVVHQLHQLDVPEDVELRHRLRMDYFPDAVGVELRHLLKMDYYQDVALPEWQVSVQLKNLSTQQPVRYQQLVQLTDVRHCFRQSRALAQL
jgi:hypothetical protein